MMRGRYCVAPTVGQAPTLAPVCPARVVGRDHEVAPERELVAAAHAPAVDHGDNRDRQAADRHREALHTSFHIAPLIQ